VYVITKILHTTLPSAEYDRLRVVRWETPRFCVYADKIERFPHHSDQFVNVKPFAGGYGDRVGDFVSGKYLEVAV
jgi:hypothetical protein